MNENLPIQHGDKALRPRARLIQAIGDELISNDIIGLIELIKNSYDADARQVIVRFEGSLEKGTSSISVLDDGHGMNLTVLLSAWMEPASGLKREQKVSRSGTRRLLGEKGLGRFAASRIADVLQLESTTAEPPRKIVAYFDWTRFRKDESYLDQIDCRWEEYEVPEGTPTGTHIKLEKLRSTWQAKELHQLGTELSRLIVNTERKKLKSFRISLELPAAYEALGGDITPPKLLKHPHYTIIGYMTAVGQLSATVGIGAEEPRDIKKVLAVKDDENSPDRTPSCGAFEFEINVWDRDRDKLEELSAKVDMKTSEIRRTLNEACGISIYRDAFRVFPYGEPNNDWLRLDMRRVQNPSMRLSNNQVVGSIYITADANPDLRDQTNRMGLLDSQAQDDLKDCIKLILVELEILRFKKRQAEMNHEQQPEESQPGLFSALDIEPIRRAFEDKYPHDKAFLKFLDSKSEAAKESVGRIQEVIVRYRRLSTLGYIVDVILHEGRTAVSTIVDSSGLGLLYLKKALGGEAPLSQAAVPDGELPPGQLHEKIKSKLDLIQQKAKLLTKLFSSLAPFSGKRRKSKATEQSVESIIQKAFSIFETQLGEHGIKVVLPSSVSHITVDAVEIEQIIVNLLTNSLYWLQRNPPENRLIQVEAVSRGENIEILFCDNGPGIPEDSRPSIFMPYFTTKPDGVGLGLTIAGEIALEYGGKLELVESLDPFTTSFRLTLPGTR